jgi:hypothetical protein
MSSPYQGSFSYDVYAAAGVGTFAPSYLQKRYKLLYQKAALADGELEENITESESMLRQIIRSNFANGSSLNNGFKIAISTISQNNNFRIQGGDGTLDGAGTLFVDGYILAIKSDYDFKGTNGQADTGNLTDDRDTKGTVFVYDSTRTPVGDTGTYETPLSLGRIDSVFVDFYFAQVAPSGSSEYIDTSLIVPGINKLTQYRVRQVQDICVVMGAENASPVAPTLPGTVIQSGVFHYAIDANGIYHRYIKIAEITRSPGNDNVSVIADKRFIISPASLFADGTTGIGTDTSGHDRGSMLINGPVGIGTTIKSNRNALEVNSISSPAWLHNSDTFNTTVGVVSYTFDRTIEINGTGTSKAGGSLYFSSAPYSNVSWFISSIDLQSIVIGSQQTNASILLNNSVGIGTNSAYGSAGVHGLQVEGTKIIGRTDTTTDLGSLTRRFKDAYVGGSVIYGTDAGNFLKFYFHDTTSGDVSAITIDGTTDFPSPKLGIGTGIPLATLHIEGSKVLGKIGGGTDLGDGTRFFGDIYLYESLRFNTFSSYIKNAYGNTCISLDSSQNVGIATDTPINNSFQIERPKVVGILGGGTDLGDITRYFGDIYMSESLIFKKAIGPYYGYLKNGSGDIAISIDDSAHVGIGTLIALHVSPGDATFEGLVGIGTVPIRPLDIFYSSANAVIRSIQSGTGFAISGECSGSPTNTPAIQGTNRTGASGIGVLGIGDAAGVQGQVTTDNATTFSIQGLNAAGIGTFNVPGAGPFNTATGASGIALYIDNQGLVGRVPASSLRFKQDILNMENTDWFYDLRPVNFSYKNDVERTKRYGLIAEEVALINETFITRDKEGIPDSVQYERFIPVLINEIKNLKNKIIILEAKLA